MSGRLEHITDWQERGACVKWSVKRLAKECRVSVRTLERHLQNRFKRCPKEWLHDLRMQRAWELLAVDSRVKEIFEELGYRHPHNFARAFKRHFGHSPTHAPPSAEPPATE